MIFVTLIQVSHNLMAKMWIHFIMLERGSQEAYPTLKADICSSGSSDNCQRKNVVPSYLIKYSNSSD
jgi:hypothetical protein